MRYPLFQSIKNCIESEIKDRGIEVQYLKTWKENSINATGLEMQLNISEISSYIKGLHINFDWDLFREISLARQLEGMEKHPLLKNADADTPGLKPNIDIEVVWQFDETETQSIVPSKVGTSRLEAASEWMENVSKNVNSLLVSEDIITRWHIEVEGDEYGRYLSTINLLSYFQYSFEGLHHLNEVHSYVARRMQHLLYRVNKVIQISDNTILKATG